MADENEFAGLDDNQLRDAFRLWAYEALLADYTQENVGGVPNDDVTRKYEMANMIFQEMLTRNLVDIPDVGLLSHEEIEALKSRERIRRSFEI